MSTRSQKGKKSPKGSGPKKGAAKEVEKEAKKAERAVKKVVKRAEGMVESKEGKAPKGMRRPTGRPPSAMVSARHGLEMKMREARGFSYGEVSAAGLKPGLARGWKFRIDSRRRTVLDSNVLALRDWGSRGGTLSRVERGARRAEGELEELGKEAEEDAAIIEEEVVKTGKKIEKEAKKAEEAIKKKAGRPKPRAKT